MDVQTAHAAAQPPVRGGGYPVWLTGEFDRPGRWLWLVKWLLLIPHVFVLVFLWIGFFVVTVIAFFAILFTGRYPRPLFDYSLGVMRWTWRVNYYGYQALGTDRYPPFTLSDVPDYPARLDIAYPERLTRWLPLVKWLLIIPHLLIVAALTSTGGWEVNGNGNGSGLGLLAAIVLIVALALLFAARYPRGLFDLVMGVNRWIVRVGAYTALMTDAYPPFRLDLGGEEPEHATQSVT
ncbi:MAG TPA: DUF4389 domain-containing protein [Micromonosporaceae bacterium]